jgi:hypothetical protein
LNEFDTRRQKAYKHVLSSGKKTISQSGVFFVHFRKQMRGCAWFDICHISNLDGLCLLFLAVSAAVSPVNFQSPVFGVDWVAVGHCRLLLQPVA